MSDNSYFAATDIIDWQTPAVRQLAKELASGDSDSVAITRRSFEWVRDEIKHSSDFKLNPVTCKASEVLAAGTGYCYAKSHFAGSATASERHSCGTLLSALEHRWRWPTVLLAWT